VILASTRLGFLRRLWTLRVLKVGTSWMWQSVQVPLGSFGLNSRWRDVVPSVVGRMHGLRYWANKRLLATPWTRQ